MSYSPRDHKESEVPEQLVHNDFYQDYLTFFILYHQSPKGLELYRQSVETSLVCGTDDIMSINLAKQEVARMLRSLGRTHGLHGMGDQPTKI